jgi:hypothetical protein
MSSTEEKTEPSKDISSQSYSVKEEEDVFTERPEHDIHYKTLSWQVSGTIIVSFSCTMLIEFMYFCSL